MNFENWEMRLKLLMHAAVFHASQNFKSIIISEWTCFNGIQSSHETDVDCGGEFCDPCNITQVTKILLDHKSITKLLAVTHCRVV